MTFPRIAALGAALFISLAAHAQTAPTPKANSAARHKVPMHPSTLTLGGKRHRQAGHHSRVRHTFNQPTPIRGTMVGPRI